MSLSIGIVGFPNVGKSTLFQTITKKQVSIENYPFCTIDPNIGTVAVPDVRVDKLSELNNSKRKIYTTIEFVDIAGLVKGASKGEGLGNKFLSHIREVSAIIEVVRCFPANNIIHIEEKINPVSDLEIINTELILKDLETIEKVIIKLDSDAKSGDKKKIKDLEIVKKIKNELENNILVFNLSKELASEQIIKELSLLTAKQQIYLLNGNEEDVNEELKNKIKSLNADYLIVDLVNSENIDELIKKTYKLLGLISFFTIGEDETRAWMIKKGEKAPQAAGTIHTDFENKFIKAEVIYCDNLLEAGGWTQAKSKGLIRLEGKDYIMQDGDIMVVRYGQ